MLPEGSDIESHIFSVNPGAGLKEKNIAFDKRMRSKAGSEQHIQQSSFLVRLL